KEPLAPQLDCMEAEVLARHLGIWSAGKGPLQQKLARALTNAIRYGAGDPGIRLPSERALARGLTLIPRPVVAPHDSLRESGWIASRTGSGTWVPEKSPLVAAARGAAQAGALASSPLLGIMAHRDDVDMIDFALGCPMPLEELPPELFLLPKDQHAALLR